MNKIKQNKKIITHTLIIASIILLAVISLQAGFAATTTTIDNTTAGGISGALSSSSPGDTIELEEGRYTGNNNSNMTINKNITITGKTKDKVILDAQGLTRGFSIGNNSNVTFINITFINANSLYYGAIYNGHVSTTMNFINCTFINNIGTAGYGAAIYNAGYLVVNDCTFVNNTSNNGYGGAIYNSGPNMIVSNSNFTNNTVKGNAIYNGYGGAIANVGSNVIVSDSIFTNNSAYDSGGAIYNRGINLLVSNCNFTENEAKNGGAVSNEGRNMTISDSDFTNNSATNIGGAVYNNGVANLTISDSAFTGNRADNYGGAIVTIGSSNMTISDSAFTKNSAAENGGVIYIAIGGGESYNMTISGSNFTDNSVDKTNGRIIVTTAINVNISNNNISDNTGIGIATIGDTTINDNIINNNTGIGIVVSGNASINDNIINDNGGVGIYIDVDGTADITNNEICGNAGNGVTNRGNATVENNNVTGNSGNDIVNTGDINGSGNFNNIQSDLAINTSVSGNKVTIRVKATDNKGNAIVGATINFYVNGKLVGTAITNSEGIAEFTYTASVSGTYNILTTMDELNKYNNSVNVLRIYSVANTTKSVNIALEKGTVITVSAPTIKEGKKTNIKVTLKDINGNILKNKKISLTIKGKTYTATTNNNGIAVFNIAGLKGGKHTLTAKFAGDSNYKSSKISKVQKVSPKTNLGIASIKKLSFRKKVSTYRVTIANKGSLKSKSTVLALFHMRNGVKIKTKYIKIKSIAPGKKISIIVSYFPDKANHRYCIAHFQIDPKNKNKEIILANNKKSISLKH